MPTTAAFLDYAVELFAPWGPVQAKRMFGGAGLIRDGRMFGLIADDQIYLKVNETNRAAFEAAGSTPFVYVSKGGKSIAMFFWSIPTEALEDAEAAKIWADRAWAATAKSKARPSSAKKRPLSRHELEELPLKPGGKQGKSVKKR